MKVEVDRHPRDEEEGIALTVYVRSPLPNYRQFKIDAWSREGKYFLRLDGFGYVQMIETQGGETGLHELFMYLATLPTEAVLAKVQEMQTLYQKVIKQSGTNVSKQPSLETVKEYFEAARDKMIAEIGPLLMAGNS
jgi:hypothetical protein